VAYSNKPIKIKASTKGSYTRRAKQHHRTVQQQARADLRPGAHVSGAIRKKANFALNFGGKGKH
jgi:hypothetical protein